MGGDTQVGPRDAWVREKGKVALDRSYLQHTRKKHTDVKDWLG